MKKIIAGFIVIATITFSATAQTTNNSDQSVKAHDKYFYKKNNQWAEKLQLTDVQKQKMKMINADFKSKMTALKSSNLSADELKAQRAALMQDKKQKSMALLTPEQKNKMAEFRKEHHGKEKMDQAKRMDKMKEKLALTDNQSAKLNAQREEFKIKAEAIKNNQSLSADQQKEQLKALREERKNSFQSILTPDQLKKMEEMKQKRMGKAA